MFKFKREEIENVSAIDEICTPTDLHNMNAFYGIEYEFNDGKLSSINIPKSFEKLKD